MRYYVISDMHSFYSLTQDALTNAGYYSDCEPHKLIICGDAFDRGHESAEMQKWICDLIDKDEVILIKGNHDNLFIDLLNELSDNVGIMSHHLSNGTVSTAIQLVSDKFNMSEYDARDLIINDSPKFADMLKDTDYYKKIIPAEKYFYETGSYVFTHGYLPMDSFSNFIPDWRDTNKNKYSWDKNALWANGIKCALILDCILPNKTIVCGHWHSSFGYHLTENKSEFDDDACYDIFRDKGIIAIDACTAWSKQVNVLVVEDD